MIQENGIFDMGMMRSVKKSSTRFIHSTASGLLIADLIKKWYTSIVFC